jgi:hypothetical protein
VVRVFQLSGVQQKTTTSPSEEYPHSQGKNARHKAFGVYNFVRKHHTLGTTPAVAAGLEEKPWSLEHVVEMTQAYFQRKTAV